MASLGTPQVTASVPLLGLPCPLKLVADGALVLISAPPQRLAWRVSRGIRLASLDSPPREGILTPALRWGGEVEAQGCPADFPPDARALRPAVLPSGSPSTRRAQNGRTSDADPEGPDAWAPPAPCRRRRPGLVPQAGAAGGFGLLAKAALSSLRPDPAFELSPPSIQNMPGGKG